MRRLTCTLVLWSLGCAAEPEPRSAVALAELGPGRRGATIELGGETLELELADRNRNGTYGEPLIDDCSAIPRESRKALPCEGVLGHRSGSYRVFVAPSGASVRIERLWGQLRLALATPPEGSIELLSGRVEADRPEGAFVSAMDVTGATVLGAGVAYRFTMVAALRQGSVSYVVPLTLSGRRVESGHTTLTLLRRIGTHPLIQTEPNSEGEPTIVPIPVSAGALTTLRFAVAGDEGEVLGCIAKAGTALLPTVDSHPSGDARCDRGIYVVPYRPGPEEAGRDRTVLVSLENPFDPAQPLEARFLVHVQN